MKKLIALALVQIAILGGIIFNAPSAVANPLTGDRDNPQRALVDNGSENRSVPEQAKNSLDKGLSVFKEATDNSLENLKPEKNYSGIADEYKDTSSDKLAKESKVAR